jgi:dTMP kinase
MDNMAHKYSGKFITLEGIEGVGKSTQLQYVKDWFAKKMIPTVVTREPGGGPVAERIRSIFLEKLPEKMTPDVELLLLFAGRSQHLSTVIIPALEEGKWVICDRFTDASYAYQGGGRNVPLERIAILESWVHDDLQPDLTLLLDAPPDLALSRVQRRGDTDRIEVEGEAFFKRVRDMYLDRAKKYDRYRVIDAAPDIEVVQAHLDQVLSQFLRDHLDVCK